MFTHTIESVHGKEDRAHHGVMCFAVVEEGEEDCVQIMPEAEWVSESGLMLVSVSSGSGLDGENTWFARMDRQQVIEAAKFFALAAGKLP